MLIIVNKLLVILLMAAYIDHLLSVLLKSMDIFFILLTNLLQ